MQINNISPNLILAPQNQNFDAKLLELKELIEAEVISVSGKNILLKTDANILLRTFNNSTPDLFVGDKLQFSATSNNDSTINLQIKSINSQSIIPTANGKQEQLLKLNVEPSPKNFEAAELLAENNIKPTPSAIKNFTQMLTKFPDIPKDIAVIFAKYPAIINNPGILNFMPEKYIPGFSQFNNIISKVETAVANTVQDTQSLEKNGNLQQSVNISSHPENSEKLDIPVKNNLSVADDINNIKTDAPAVYKKNQNIHSEQNIHKEQNIHSENKEIQNYDLMKNVSSKDTAVTNIVKSLKNIFFPLIASENENGKELKLSTTLAHTKLQNIVKQLPDSFNDIKSCVQTLRAQNQLVHEMNNFYFAQVPFMFNEHRNTADLYVMKRNAKAKTIDPNNAKIALCLQTENIGIVESVITVEAKNVNLQINVQSDEIVWQMRSFSPNLAELLHDIGYHLNSLNVKKLKEPISPLNVEKCFEINKPQKIGVLDLEL